MHIYAYICVYMHMFMKLLFKNPISEFGIDISIASSILGLALTLGIHYCICVCIRIVATNRFSPE